MNNNENNKKNTHGILYWNNAETGFEIYKQRKKKFKDTKR